MGQIKVTRDLDGISGLCIIEPAVHGDERGYFIETYNAEDMRQAGFDIKFVQDNQSMSVRGVLRGLHFQKNYPQTKLVRVIKGSVFDVAVDIRRGSPTYGKWHGEVLSEQNNKQFLIPRGFAHGFLVLSETAVFCYKCDEHYHADDEGGIAWNDPLIGIKWPDLEGEYRNSASAEGFTIDGAPLIMSIKDQMWPGLQRPGTDPCGTSERL